MPAAEETMTKADFYAEVKKREDASIAAKKWGTVNVSGTQTKNGVTANVYANNAPDFARYGVQHGETYGFRKRNKRKLHERRGVRVFRDAKKHCDFQHRRGLKSRREFAGGVGCNGRRRNGFGEGYFECGRVLDGVRNEIRKRHGNRRAKTYVFGVCGRV